MSDSEGEEETTSFVPFSERPEWKDVVPIPQDDGPDPVCKIAYSTEFSQIMDYFRAIIQKDERSERAFQLTEEVIRQNAAHYTAWYFRRLCIDALKCDLKKELEFITKIGTPNPKNYQIWFHRRIIVEKLGDYSKELEYTAFHIKKDSKNYHAWAHRQWVIETYNLWENELSYLDELIKEDFRNNSSWNQRYFTVTHNKKAPLTKEIVEKEIDFSFLYIKRAPNNESPWVYLKGICFTSADVNSIIPQVKKMCLDFKRVYVTSPHVNALLVDIYEQENTVESISKATELCDELEKNLDSLHKKYWVYRKSQLKVH